jgi:hypothetical protein
MTNYLPRINTILNDQGLKVAPPPAGPKVTILGVTSNPAIPVNEPFTIGSVEKAINSLYFSYDGNTYGYASGQRPGEMSLAIEEAVNGGAPNIEVMVIKIASGDELVEWTAPWSAGKERYDVLEDAYEVLRNRELDVVAPAGIYLDDQIYDDTGTLEAPSSPEVNFGKQLADLCFQATTEENSCVGVIPTRPVLSWAMRNCVVADTGAGGSYYAGYTTGATDGLGFQTNTILSGEMDTLFGVEWISGGYGASKAVQLLAHANVEFGTPSTTLVKEWHAYHAYLPNGAASFVSDMHSGKYISTAYRGWLAGAEDSAGNILSDIDADTASEVSSLYFASWQATDSDGNVAVDSRSEKVDVGAYLSVFSTPLRAVTTQTSGVALTLGAALSNTSRNTSGGHSYAGLITSLAPQSSTTNKQVGGVVQAKLLSAKQANDLTGMRHVTMYSRSSGLTVASGMTGAHNVSKYVRSDYVRLTTVRTTHAAVDLIRSVANKYIGEPNNAPQMNALDAEIDQVLLSMKGSGALNAYSFSISSTPDQRVLGELDINLTLVPAFEITTINLTVSLSKEL